MCISSQPDFKVEAYLFLGKFDYMILVVTERVYTFMYELCIITILPIITISITEKNNIFANIFLNSYLVTSWICRKTDTLFGCVNLNMKAIIQLLDDALIKQTNHLKEIHLMDVLFSFIRLFGIEYMDIIGIYLFLPTVIESNYFARQN